MSKKAKRKYNWPPPPDPYVPLERNPIHSILTALPVIMLLVGLFFYYSGESEQTHGAPIFEESESLTGVFSGLSVVRSGSQGRHYLWLNEGGTERGVRIRPEQHDHLDALARGENIILKIAPTVHESSIYWAWYIEQNGVVYANDEDRLQ